MKKLWLLSVGLVLSLGLSSCSMAASSPDLVNPGYDTGGSSGNEDVSGGDKSEGFAPTDGSSSDRSVIKTASAYLTAENPATAAAEVVALSDSKLGRVDQRTVLTDADGVPYQASLVLRIPTDSLEAVLDQLPSIGQVQSLEVGASDVTVTVRDLEARVAALDTSVTRLLDLLSRAATTSELIEIESALTQRQAELDGLKSTLSYYRDAVSYATLSVTIVTEQDALPNTPDNFWEGLVAGWQGLVAFGEGLLISSGVALPWLIALGAPAAAITVLLIRRLRRGKKTANTKTVSKN